MKSKLRFLVVFAALIQASCSTPSSDSLTQAQFGPRASEFIRPNLVFFTPGEQAVAENEVPFILEVLKGDTRKIEARTASGHFFLDRVECARDGNDPRFPTHYGFAAGRFNVDGDPLDVLVLGEDTKYEAMSRTRKIEPSTVRVIGMIQMEECALPPWHATRFTKEPGA